LGARLWSIKANAQSIEQASFLSLVGDQVAQAVVDALSSAASQPAKEALRGSEESIRMIVDSIPGLVVAMTAAGELEFVSQQCLDYSGKALDELRGWTTSDLIHPDDLSRVLVTWRSPVETGQPYESEYRIRRADGVYRWFQVRALPVRDTEGRIIHWYVLHTDIDKRKQAEDRLQLLLDVTNQVVSNLQLRDLLRAVSGSIRRVMQCDCASLALPHEENEQLQLYVLDFPEGDGFLYEEGFYPIDGSPYGTAFRTMKPLALASPFAAWLDNPVVQNRISEGFKSLCFLPLISRNRAIGTLNLGRLRGKAFTDEELYFLGQVASQIAIAVENTSAYHEITRARTELEKALGEIKQRTEALRRSEGYLAEAQKLTHTGSWAWNVRTGVLFWSQEIFRIYNYQPQEMGPTWPQFFQRVHPEDRPQIEQKAKMETTQKDWVDSQADFRIVLPDGKIKRLHTIAHPVMDESGEITEVVGTVMDVTEQWNARTTLEKALEEIQRLKDRLQDENLALREQIDQALMFEEIVGTSPALRAVLSRVSKVAPTDSTVLLTGETGTGKELVARAIHKRSRRSSRAFVSVNCAAIPSSLIASELFGHEKGAFTGATQRRLGRFELAEEGTLFLDEVSELPAETQIMLLRVLQEREFQRVGGNQNIRANVRVVAATNRDLEAAIAAGTFRSDLFYRLNVFPIEIPPLRERREDIPLLVEYFIAHFARKEGKCFRGINRKTMDLLLSYPWPGNIRELQNVVERSVIVCETENFSVDESWLSRQPVVSGSKRQLELSENLSGHEKKMIEDALRESGGQVSGPSGAAAKLGIHRSTLESKISSLKIDKYLFKTASASKNF